MSPSPAGLTGEETARIAQRRENATKAAYVRTIVDPGVALYVATLIEAGVETYESCQGGPHEDREARGGYDHAYPEPTVRFHGSQGAGWWALQVCLDHAFPVQSLSRIWTVEDREPHGPTWQIVFREMASDARSAAPLDFGDTSGWPPSPDPRSE